MDEKIMPGAYIDFISVENPQSSATGTNASGGNSGVYGYGMLGITPLGDFVLT